MAEKTLYALIAPKSIKVTEKYAYKAEISRNPEIALDLQEGKQEPTGQIEVIIPYDGERYFTEQQRKLIEFQQPMIWKQADASVRIGYFGFSHYEDTDLASSLNLGLEHDTLALDLPLNDPDLPDAAYLLQDRQHH